MRLRFKTRTKRDLVREQVSIAGSSPKLASQSESIRLNPSPVAR